MEADCLPRCTERTLPCFAGPLSALGRAEFRILQEAGAAALPSQRVPQALGVPGAAAPPHPVRCDPGPTSHPRGLLGGAQEELRVLSLLRNSASVGLGMASQDKAEVQRAEQSPDSGTQLAASSQGTAQ